MRIWPNKALEPIRMLVTNRAFSALRAGTIRAKHTNRLSLSVRHTKMKTIHALLIAMAVSLGGCVTYNREPNSEYLAPVNATEGIAQASIQYPSLYARWPESLEQIRDAFSIAGIDPAALDYISDIVILNRTETSSVYVLKFTDGGISTIKLNTNSEK
jgi:hypothetical protein